MDLAERALQTNGKLFSNFELMAEKRKILKQIVSHDSRLNIDQSAMCYTYQRIRIDKLYKLMEKFFQILAKTEKYSTNNKVGCMQSNYASPTSGEAYRDWRLTTNFELWVEIFCVPTCFHMRIPKPCLSVRLSSPREKISSYLRQYQSYISNWYINGKVFTSTTPWEPENLIFFSKKFEIRKFVFWRRAEITLASSISVLH